MSKFFLKIKMSNVLHSKYGTAKLENNGYYNITTRKEGNPRKRLHRLIYEDNFGVIPKGYVIHHKDGNKLNNCIINLEAIPHSKHSTEHNTGEINPTKKLDVQLKISKSKNTTGYFRVSKQEDNGYKQGFCYRYAYIEKGKRKAIVSKNIDDLKQKVLSKNLPWKKY